MGDLGGGVAQTHTLAAPSFHWVHGHSRPFLLGPSPSLGGTTEAQTSGTSFLFLHSGWAHPGSGPVASGLSLVIQEASRLY